MDSRYAERDKGELRSVYAAARNALDASKRKQWSREVCRHAATLAERTSARTIMAYVSFRSELDLSELIEWCWRKDVRVIVPRCTFADRGMTLHELKSFEQLRPGAYGIMEPDPALAEQLPSDSVPDIVMVPGLAFDKVGGRLGYGGGYYDLFSERMSILARESGKETIWLGVSFEAQLQDHVPGESHDLRLDGVVTEQTIYWSGTTSYS
ncbi:5-formyltetrahydrofolate cyclo-ligase [Paenibacillus sp. LHD-117]|uniref:5-formyltetrahydrofolate cyclo-ligase n=1 Tax=Paenibacillus sp. LHD-117 TaxID=3071412 RepID=UPI0027DF6CCB|nr:5-formyltetrahydrofolate cyclo-ligase [Paenibacillus sp. LHD-117]MDQ6420102.1 5-formyltetrahydrofolate cyclo-ligase [Paenibacillus sp. LHD-117]